MNYVLRRKGVGEKIGSIAEYSEEGLVVVRSDRLAETEGLADAEYCFRWGTTATIPNSSGVQSVNSPTAIHLVYDKRKFRTQMANEGLAPNTWIDFGDLLESDAEYPMIVRPEHHIRSRDMILCKTVGEVYRACQKFERYYISEFIPKDREFRVFVIQGRVVAVVEKMPKDRNDISWGCVEEGTFKYVPWTEWPLIATEMAVRAFCMSGLDFGAVDVLGVSAGSSGPERAYVLEINTAPELTPYYLKVFTKCFDHIVRNGKERLPITLGQGFKGMIHPAISNMAIV